MIIRTQYIALPYSEVAKLPNSDGLYVLNNEGYQEIKSIEQMESFMSGHLYKKILVEYPNEIEFSGLYVTKQSDGSVDFDVIMNYDVYRTALDEDEAKQLAQFLQKPYVSE